MSESFDNHDDDIEFISKTQLKNEAKELTEFGKKLCGLSKSQQSGLTLSETLMAALNEFRRIKSKEAQRRHINYIGKLLRSEDIDQLKFQVDLLDPSSDAYVQINHRRERLRDELLDETKDSFADFIQQYPQADIQHLRQLIRNARKEHKQIQQEEKPSNSKGAVRKLFLYIKELDEGNL